MRRDRCLQDTPNELVDGQEETGPEDNAITEIILMGSRASGEREEEIPPFPEGK